MSRSRRAASLPREVSPGSDASACRSLPQGDSLPSKQPSSAGLLAGRDLTLSRSCAGSLEGGQLLSSLLGERVRCCHKQLETRALQAAPRPCSSGFFLRVRRRGADSGSALCSVCLRGPKPGPPPATCAPWLLGFTFQLLTPHCVPNTSLKQLSQRGLTRKVSLTPSLGPLPPCWALAGGPPAADPVGGVGLLGAPSSFVGKSSISPSFLKVLPWRWNSRFSFSSRSTAASMFLRSLRPSGCRQPASASSPR